MSFLGSLIAHTPQFVPFHLPPVLECTSSVRQSSQLSYEQTTEHDQTTSYSQKFSMITAFILLYTCLELNQS
jgi:hypothetical protein